MPNVLDRSSIFVMAENFQSVLDVVCYIGFVGPHFWFRSRFLIQ